MGHAHSLAVCFFCRYIDRIRQTLVSVVGQPEQQQPLQYEQMKNLPFLQACFYEAVRVSSAVEQCL